MSVNGTPPTPKLDPQTPATPAEFVALLRQLREQSGLAYRAIERRAASAGDTLPPSTLATMLNRTTLPREELVVALLRAVGHDEKTINDWVLARRALATSTDPAPAEIAEPAKPPRNPMNPRILAAVIGALVLVVGTIVVLQLTRSAEFPSGPVNIRSANSGFCLTEQHDTPSGHLFQAPCAEAWVPRSFEANGGGTYRILTDHPEYGPGCMGAENGAAVPGNPLVDSECPPLKESVVIRLIEIKEPVSGYQIMLVESGLCAEVVGSSLEPWAAVQILGCDSARKGQIFQLEAIG